MTFSKLNIEPEFGELVNEFPEIFLEPSFEVEKTFEAGDRRMGKPMSSVTQNKDDLCNLRYGFEHDVGWIEILREFCAACRELIKNAESKEARITAFIVKEKFGALEWQGNVYNLNKEEFSKYLELRGKLREKSLTTCEVSGKVGSLRKTEDGWRKTLCEEEAIRLKYELGGTD